MTFSAYTLRPVPRFAGESSDVFTAAAARGHTARASAPQPRPELRPVALSVHESAQGYRLRAELPGVKRAALDLEVQHGWLTLRGHFPAWGADPAAGKGPRFERAVQLPEDVDAAAIRAELADGVLTVDLPRRAAAQPRQVTVA
jgi:HSP20 family protein